MGHRACIEQAVVSHLDVGTKWMEREEASAPRAFYSRRRGRECGGGLAHWRRQAGSHWCGGNLMR
jgi:hypothetical protein